MTVLPITPMRPTARPRPSRDMGAMGQMCCCPQPTLALDAERAKVLASIKGLLK